MRLNPFQSTKVVVAIIGCLALAGSVIGVIAQSQRGLPDGLVTVSPIVSGGDIGFRLDRVVDGIAVGKIVIRVEDRWVDTAAPVTVVR